MAYANDHYKCTPLDQISKDGHRCRQVATPRAFIEIMHEKRRRDWALKQQKICFPAEDHLLNVTFFQRLESNVKRSQILRVGDMVFYARYFFTKEMFFLRQNVFFYPRDIFLRKRCFSFDRQCKSFLREIYFFTEEIFSLQQLYFFFLQENSIFTTKNTVVKGLPLFKILPRF